jgi:5-methylthioadenosine/S-adenosylhomocysteine deaminase
MKKGRVSLTSLSVEGGTVVTVDRHRRVIQHGCVFIEEGKITFVGKIGEKPPGLKPEIVIDARGRVVMPGLIDTHVHLAQALIRGCADDLSLVDWLQHRVWPLQGSYDESDGLLSSELCMLEMLKSGTTTFLESGLHHRYGVNGIAELTKRVGLRAFLSKMIMDGSGYGDTAGIMPPGMVEERDACLNEAESLFRNWNGVGRIKVWLAARSLGAVSPGLYREIGEMARRLGTGLTMHLNEVPEDSTYSIKQFGKTPVEMMNDLGILGERAVFAHMVWATDREVELLSKSGSSVAHCPSSNAKLASGIARVPEMIKKGVKVGLGCDGAPCNNTYDMLREMRIASLLQKARLLNPAVMPAEQVLEMATINGARALGVDNEVGSIEVGKRADLILIDTNRPSMTPLFDPVSAVVYGATGEDVETVMVDGEILMQNRIVSTIDEERVLRQAQSRGMELLERVGIRVSPDWPVT